MRKIPLLLICFRLLIGIFLVVFSLSSASLFIPVAIILITVGLLSDVFDGIIARRLNVSTTVLRRLDSIVDQIFWISIAIACYIRYPDFFRINQTKIIILVATELLTYVVCFIKFKEEVATNAII